MTGFYPIQEDSMADSVSVSAAAGRCATCRFWQQDYLAEHRGHGIRGQVQWKSCTRGEYLAARTGHPYTSEDFGCILWEAASGKG
jgi:hypothetical protein